MRSIFALAALTAIPLSLTPPIAAQEPVDLGTVMRIRSEGFKNSRVMDTLWHLTDLYGPRLTNSPQQTRAAEWARDRLIEFGLEDATLEEWGEFGLGWSFERCNVALIEPTYMPLIALPKAWTSGTSGEIVGTPVLIEADTMEELEKYEGKLQGKIVLKGAVNDVESPFDALATRHDDESLGELLEAPELEESQSRAPRATDWRVRRAVRSKLRKMLKDEGALVVIEPDGGRRKDYGVITLGGGGSRDPEEERAAPQVVVSTEHFNRLVRLLEHKKDVVMSVDVRTTFHDEDTKGHNVVASIPGADPVLKDEVVMLGAHFDSWHAGTGATDNGCSSAVVMEAARILSKLDLQPRRTIRFALWTGEEQGLLGSRNYVKNHFGDRSTMELLPEHAGLAAYFNLDNGGGKIRGVYLQENAAIRPVFEAWLEPFHDLGARALTIRNTGGTDHLSFDSIGLPGFQFIQDPMDYKTRSHHTNMDLYERVHPSDVKQAAVIMASFAYNAAMRDEKLPRKPLRKPRPRPEEPQPVEAGAATEKKAEEGSSGG